MKEEVHIRILDFEKDIKILDQFMQELHESEKELNPRTANWKRIRKHYLNYVKECLNENDGVILLAEQYKKSVGFLFGYVDEPDDSDFEGGSGNDLYVSEGYVVPEYRNKGIYTLLNSAFEAHYKDYDIRRIYRYTLVVNEPMNHWLKRQGYSPIRMVYEKWLK